MLTRPEYEPRQHEESRRQRTASAAHRGSRYLREHLRSQLYLAVALKKPIPIPMAYSAALSLPCSISSTGSRGAIQLLMLTLYTDPCNPLGVLL
jgi:hypothetical protein